MLKDSKYKTEWLLLVLTHSNDQPFYQNVLNDSGIQSTIVNVSEDNNYMTKCHTAVSISETINTPYMMKCDNDVLLPAQTLDYMIENLSLLDDPKHLTLGPVLSSGIPGVEYFAREFLSDDQRVELEKKYLQTTFYDRDGAQYSYLNAHTTQTNQWNCASFFEGVKQSAHHYKGVHPIRFNMDAIAYLNECILNTKLKFFNCKPDGIHMDPISPYLCDTIFCIRRDIYKSIINDPSLFVDGYDEVPLNKYAWMHGLSHLFTKNGFAIHILYNWFDTIFEYEQDFCTKLFA
jgi:hypothetical protein